MQKNQRLRVIIILVILVCLITTLYKFLATADLRTDFAKNNSNKERGKSLVKEMGEAHGIGNWHNIESYQVIFEDEFFGFIGSQSQNFGQAKNNFILNYIPSTFDGRLAFSSGVKENEIWGIQSWKTYTKNPNSEVVFEDDKDIKFWLPTYQYFIEFPMRIQNANSFNFAGEKMIDGIPCVGVMASWKTTEPQSGIDQYLIWIDKENKRMVKLEYTIREMYRFLTGAVIFKNYQIHNKILLPSLMSVESNIVPKGLLHEMRIQDFQPDVTSISKLRPDASLPIMGDRKE